MRALLLVLKKIAPPLIGIILVLKSIFFLGIAFSLLPVDEAFWLNWTEFATVSSGPIDTGIQLAIAVLCFLVGILFLASTVTSRKEGLLDAPSEGGRITIQMQTAMEFVRKTAQNVPGVLDAHPKRVWQKGGVTFASVDILPDFDKPVSSVAADVQDRVRTELEQTLGLPSVQDVNVGIMPPKGRTVPSAASRSRKKTEDPMDEIRSSDDENKDTSSPSSTL